ncbi:maleate cis-trans isomerase [Gordonia sp. NPDC003585]|uniref:maleate cis-trans isomerase family protein n=1 Tax=Gordonia sp. NPDC003585 TaxID=3154275 RepID=UPI0033B54EFB
MTTTVAMLYPGHAAEDDYALIETALADRSIRLPVVITEVESDDHTVEAMLSVGESDRLLDGARRAAVWEPTSVMWACTSGSFLYGWEGAHQQVDRLTESCGLPASSTSLAFAAACAALGMTRVAVAATYPYAVAAGFGEFMTAAGVEVVALHAHDVETASEAGTLDGDGLFDMLSMSDSDDAQALLIPDTALHTAMWVNGLEEKFGKPVLTANQVTVWQGLRLCGMSVFAPELGSLFASH